VDQFAEALHTALLMPEEEQERRMRRMRQQIIDNNIYRWAGMLLSEAAKLAVAQWMEPPCDRTTVNADVNKFAEIGL
jgi:trehalose-6-phosphate synthase